MDLKDRKIQIEIGVIILCLAIIAWIFLGRKSEPEAFFTEVAQDPVEAIIGRELLSILEKMKSVKLDVSLFNDPVYKSMEDTAVEIPKQPIGRRDPFAPFGQ